MEAANLQSTTRSRWIRLAGMVVFVVTVLLTWMFMTSSGPGLKTQPGHIIDEYGTYLSPSGAYQIEIFKTDADTVLVNKIVPIKHFGVLPSTNIGTMNEFEVERDWFVCFDEYDRLWLYHGRWDPQWGTLRTLPSGGTIPYAPAVMLEGFFASPTGILSGIMVVNSTGDWQGVPREFFERLPDRHDPLWGNSPPIPSSPPKFASVQEKEIAKYLNSRARARQLSLSLKIPGL